MSETYESPLLSEADFDVRDPEELAVKESLFIEDGPDNVRVEVDLDGTLYYGSIWENIRRALPDKIREDHEELRKKYAPLLDEGALKPEDASKWQISALMPLVGLPIASLDFPEGRGHNIRPATHELFSTCKEFDIPITVVSASIAQVVRNLLEREGLEASEVVATELQIVQGIIQSWVPATMTDDINKANVRYGVPRATDSRENVIAIGDHVSDTLLVSGVMRSISMRANGGVESKTPAGWEEYLDKSFGRGPKRSPYPPYDVVLRKNNLYAAEQSIRHIATAKRKRLTAP